MNAFTALAALRKLPALDLTWTVERQNQWWSWYCAISAALTAAEKKA